MGYTHHWHRRPILDAALYAAAATDFGKLLPEFRKADLKLTGWGGDPAQGPYLTDSEIEFNGVPGCESFVFPQSDREAREPFNRKGSGFVYGFVKTRQLPYDLAVTAALLIMKHHHGDAIEVMSDGLIDAWQPAIALVERVLAYGTKWEFVVEEDGEYELRSLAEIKTPTPAA